MDVTVKITPSLYNVDEEVLRRFSAKERKCISNVDGIKFVDNNLEITQYSQV